MCSQSVYLNITCPRCESQMLGFCFIGGGSLLHLLGIVMSSVWLDVTLAFVMMYVMPIILVIVGSISLMHAKIVGNRPLSDEHKAILADYIRESYVAQQFVQSNAVALMNYKSFESVKRKIEQIVILQKAESLPRAN